MKKLTTFNSNGYLCNKRACCIVKHRSTKSSVYSKHHLQIDVNQTLKHVVLGICDHQLIKRIKSVLHQRTNKKIK